MKRIDISFRLIRAFTMVIIVCYTVILVIVLFQWHNEAVSAKGRLYVLANGKAIEAFASSRHDNLMVEGMDHVRTFHENFFSLEPDEKVIQSNVGKSFYLADESAKIMYGNLRESGYYSSVIAGNISQRIVVDSVVIDNRRTPLYFKCYARETISRTSSTVHMSLVTEGYLVESERSVNNSHGFRITKWRILENRDLTDKTK